MSKFLNIAVGLLFTVAAIWSFIEGTYYVGFLESFLALHSLRDYLNDRGINYN